MEAATKPMRPVTTITISTAIYEDDLDELDALVESVHALGGKNANQNRLIRVAIRLLHELTPEQIVSRLATMPTQRR